MDPSPYVSMVFHNIISKSQVYMQKFLQ